MGNTKQSKELNVAKTSKNTELFFGLCTTYGNKNVKHNKTNIAPNNEILISKEQNPRDLDSFVLYENVLFHCKNKMGLSSPVATATVLNLNSPLCPLKLYGNEVATEEESPNLLIPEVC